MTHGLLFDLKNKFEKNPKKINLLGNGNQKKPYLHVDDLLDAVLLLHEKTNDKMNFFNIGVDSGTSVDEIANIVIANFSDIKTKKIFTGGDVGWPGDVPKFEYDISKITNLGWSASLSSTEAVDKAVRENIN